MRKDTMLLASLTVLGALCGSQMYAPSFAGRRAGGGLAGARVNRARLAGARTGQLGVARARFTQPGLAGARINRARLSGLRLARRPGATPAARRGAWRGRWGRWGRRGWRRPGWRRWGRRGWRRPGWRRWGWRRGWYPGWRRRWRRWFYPRYGWYGNYYGWYNPLAWWGAAVGTSLILGSRDILPIYYPGYSYYCPLHKVYHPWGYTCDDYFNYYGRFPWGTGAAVIE